MASNPDQFLEALIGTTGLAPIQQLQANQQNLQIGQQQQQLNTQQIQGNQFALDAKQREQQTQQQYQTDVQAYFRDPSPRNLAALMAKYPQQADELKKAWNAYDEPTRNSRLRTYGSLFHGAKAGRSDLVTQNLEGLIAAEKAQGLDTTEAESLLAEIKAGDKAALSDVQAFAQVQLASGDSAFAKSIGAVNEDYTLGQGQTRYDGNNQPVASVAPKQEYLIIPEGGRAEPVPGTGATALPGGGGPSSAPGNTPPGVRRSQGWSPRRSQGGDNSDAAVDGKIANLSRSLGVDPDTPLTAEQFAKLGPAIAATEGGPGSLADRNNNPGNIKDGPFARSQPGYVGPGEGGFAKFRTPAAGMAATQSLLGRYRGRGQVTIRDIIEGRPTGGAAPRQAQAGPAGTIYGAPKRGWRTMTPDEATAANLDPAIRWQQSPDGQIQPIPGQKAQAERMSEGEAEAEGLPPGVYYRGADGVPRRAGDKPIPLRQVPTPIAQDFIQNRSAIRNVDSALRALDAYPGGVGVVIGNTPNWISSRADPKGVDLRATISNIGSLQIHDRSGAAVTISEYPRLLPFVPMVTDDAATVRKKLKRLRAELSAINQDYEAMYGEDQGYRPVLSGADQARPQTAPQSRRTGKGSAPNNPVIVRSIQEAQKLPKGTYYVAPGGRLYRR